ncbi:MAG: hypothetical protein ACI8QC_001755 [Planctomycetota bacterium]
MVLGCDLLPSYNPAHHVADSLTQSPHAEFRGGAQAAPPWALLGVCVALGLGLRFLLWSLAGPIELQSDEANYLHLAVQWEYLGFYPDNYRFLWPPGYPAYLRLCIQMFGEGALDAARVGQILASSSIGLCTGLLGWRLFGRRAAILACAGWALYLPMAAFTHLLWNETLFLALFLPSLYQLLVVAQSAREESTTRRLLISGVCFAAALYIKEAATYLLPVWMLLLALASNLGPSLEGLRRSALFGLTVLACILPWSLRNKEVYGELIPLGSSLGENAFNGLNASYRNFDLIPLEGARARAGQGPFSIRASLNAAPQGSRSWKRAEEIASLPARSAENTRRGLSFAAKHPAWFLRSRVQKLSDVVVPTTFLTRHLALGHYGGALGNGLRPIVAWGSALEVVLLLLLGGAGLLGSLPAGVARRLAWITVAYFLATAALVAMSRFRLPWVPLLLAGFGGLVSSGPPKLAYPRARVAAWCAALFIAWWINAPVLAEVWSMVLGQGAPA